MLFVPCIPGCEPPVYNVDPSRAFAKHALYVVPLSLRHIQTFQTHAFIHVLLFFVNFFLTAKGFRLHHHQLCCYQAGDSPVRLTSYSLIVLSLTRVDSCIPFDGLALTTFTSIILSLFKFYKQQGRNNSKSAVSIEWNADT